MADQESTTEEPTVETQEVLDTTVETADESTLEDIEVDLDESEDETTDTVETETEDETEVEQAEVSDEDTQKAFNKEMAEKRIHEKQQRELTVKEQQDEYLATAEDNRDLAVKQLQIDAYNNKVEGNTNKLTNGYERALKDFDILADQSPEIKAEVDQAIDAFQAMHVTIDAYGNPTDVRGDLYSFLQNKAESIRRLTDRGVRKQADSKAKESSRVITPPSRAPKTPKVDPDLAAFDEEADKW